MAVWVPAIALLVCHLATVLFASTLGGRAEKLGAANYALNLGLTWAAQASGEGVPLYAFIAIDLIAVLVFGYLMVRNPEKLWPGVAACAQLLVLMFSVTRVLDFPLSELSYLIMLNASTLICAGALACGTWASRWRKRQPSEWDLAAEAVV